MTTLEHRPTVHSEPGIDVAPGSFDALVADGAEVALRLAEFSQPRVISIPPRAAAMVAGLDDYGD